MNVYIPFTARLPSEYQEVEYIETTGTQWIGTGLFASNNIQTEVKIEVSTTNMDKPVFGNVAPSNIANSYYYHLTCYQNKWYCGLNGGETSGGTYNNTIGTQYTIIYNNSNNMLNVNGSDVVSVNGTVGAGTQLAISYRGGNATYYGQYKYFYFKMYNKTTGEYERDFVPCYRKSDSVIGMYDLVNDQFYTNSGTGTFSKGNDVTMSEVKNIYIGEYKWKPGENTIAYFPLKDDQLDKVGGKTLPLTGTKQTIGYQFSVGHWTASVINNTSSVKFVSCWFNYISGSSNVVRFFDAPGFQAYYFAHPDSSFINHFGYENASGNRYSFAPIQISTGWHLISMGWDGTTYYAYVDGVLVGTANDTRYSSDCDMGQYINIIYSELILESDVWSADKVSAYYNQTKSNYGL